MPIFLAALGALLIMTSINGQYAQVGAAFEQDVMGNGQGGGFLNFIVGIVGIAAFFRLIGMPNAGKVFIVLVILAYMIKNANLLTALESLGSSSSTATTPATTPASATALNATPVTTPAPAPTGQTTPSGQGGIGAA